MARTPITSFGKIELHYEAYARPHILHFYVGDFLPDPLVGTFVTGGTPASLDALATEITNVMIPLYPAAAALNFGEWIGLEHSGGESYFPIVNGVITAAVATPYPPDVNQPGAPTQQTYTFRDALNKHMRIELLGAIYVASTVYRYGGLGGAFLPFANYFIGNTRIRSRADAFISSMVSLTFDTNEGLQRRYRR